MSDAPETLSAAQLAAIHRASEDVLAEATQFLAQLIQIDTTNPPGVNYRAIAVLIRDRLQALGYEDAALLEVAEQDLEVLAPHDPERHERVNVMGRLKSRSHSPSLVTVGGTTREKTIHFNGHTDVVPAGDLATWTHPPFGAEVHDGVMYGRGASDMKGGLAAAIYAVEAVRRAGLVLKGTVEQSGVVDEESTGVRNAGAGWLVEQGYVSPATCDAVVITEPLNVENVCLGHRGAIWGTITFAGRAAHGATPQRGVNALVHAATFVLRANEQIGAKLAAARDARVVPEEAQAASLTFTVLHAGRNTNSVPDRATLRFDRRLGPSETPAAARAQLHAVLAGLRAAAPDVAYTYAEDYATAPVWVAPALEVCRVRRAAVARVVGAPAGVVCSPGSDDQRFFVRGGLAQTIVRRGCPPCVLRAFLRVRVGVWAGQHPERA